MWAQIAAAAIPAAIDLGAKWLGNELISQPNSALSFEQTKAAMELQNKYNIAAADKSWKRSLEAATIANSRNVYNARTAFEREINTYGKRYQLTMKDMEKAGLNPILAASQGFNVGSGVSGQMANAPIGSVPSYSVGMAGGNMPTYPEVGNSALSFASRDKAIADTVRSVADTDLIVQKTLESMQDVYTKRANQGLMEQQERESASRTYNLGLESYEISARINKTLEEVTVLQTKSKLNLQEIEKLKIERSKISKDIKLLESKIKQTDLYVKRLKNISPVWDDLGNTYMQGIHQIFKSILDKSTKLGILEDYFKIYDLGKKIGGMLR